VVGRVVQDGLKLNYFEIRGVLGKKEKHSSIEQEGGGIITDGCKSFSTFHPSDGYGWWTKMEEGEVREVL